MQDNQISDLLVYYFINLLSSKRFRINEQYALKVNKDESSIMHIHNTKMHVFKMYAMLYTSGYGQALVIKKKKINKNIDNSENNGVSR